MKHQYLDNKPTTAFILTMRYNSPYVLLDKVLQDYLPHINSKTAYQKANSQELPFPVFKADKNSNKSKFIVRITDLAKWLDNCAQDAEDEWKKVNE